VDTGHLKLRNGIKLHLEEGRIDAIEFTVFLIMLLYANYSKGTYYGCAEKLNFLMPQWNLRTIQRKLLSLEKKGYIKRLLCHGKRGNYVTVIHKFLVTDGSLTGKYVDAMNTIDSEDIKTMPVTDQYTEECTEECAEEYTEVSLSSAPIKDIRLKEKRKKTLFKAPELSDVSNYMNEYANEKNMVIDLLEEPDKFFDYYESNGWLVGKNKMKDWKASVRKWVRNNQDNGKKFQRKTKGDLNNERAREHLRSKGILDDFNIRENPMLELQ